MTLDFTALNKAILEKLVTLIKAKGISQSELAKALDLPQPSISNLLAGKSRLTVEQFCRIAQILEASPSEIMETSENAASLRSEMPVEMSKAIYRSAEHFIAYVAASIPTHPKEIAGFVGSESKAGKVFKDLVDDGLLNATKSGFVQKAVGKTFRLKRNNDSTLIYRQVIERVWARLDANLNNREYGQDRFQFYLFELLTESQAKKVDRALFEVYELLNLYSIQNMIREYRTGEKMRLWAFHMLAGTPLE